MTGRGALYCIAALAVGACGTAQYAKAWEENHRDFLMPGYEDFKGEVNGTDDGYIVASYRLPAQARADTAIAEIRAVIVAKQPCYQPTQQTGERLSLRCAGGRLRQGFRVDEEYHFLLDGKRRRVFMLVIDSVQRPRYREFLGALDDAAR